MPSLQERLYGFPPHSLMVLGLGSLSARGASGIRLGAECPWFYQSYG